MTVSPTARLGTIELLGQCGLASGRLTALSLTDCKTKPNEPAAPWSESAGLLEVPLAALAASRCLSGCLAVCPAALLSASGVPDAHRVLCCLQVLAGGGCTSLRRLFLGGSKLPLLPGSYSGVGPRPAGSTFPTAPRPPLAHLASLPDAHCLTDSDQRRAGAFGEALPALSLVEVTFCSDEDRAAVEQVGSNGLTSRSLREIAATGNASLTATSLTVMAGAARGGAA